MKMAREQIFLRDNLRILRRRKGLTQQQVASALNISRGRYSKWEDSDNQPSLTMLVALARHFHLTVDELVAQPLPKLQVSA